MTTKIGHIVKISNKELMDELDLRSSNTVSHMKKNDLKRYELLCDGLKYRRLQKQLQTKNVEFFVQKVLESLKTLTVIVKRIKGLDRIEHDLAHMS